MYRIITLLCLFPALALAQSQPQPIVTAKPLGELLQEVVHSAPAQAVALNEPTLAAEISGTVQKIAVKVGDQVEPGTLLLSLDCRDYQSRLAAQQATLSQRQAELDLAQTQLARAKELREKNSISAELLDQRDKERRVSAAMLRSQRDAVKQANNQVERCTVVSPFRAVVRQRLISEGSYASPGTPLLELVQLDGAEVSAQLTEQEVESMTSGVGHRFRYSGKDYKLQPRTVLPLVEGATRTRTVRLRFTDGDAVIGAHGRMRWRDGRRQIGADMLVRRGKALGLFLLDGDKARFHPLPEAVEGQPCLVDLPDDTRMIVDGREVVTDGEPVKLMEQE